MLPAPLLRASGARTRRNLRGACHVCRRMGGTAARHLLAPVAACLAIAAPAAAHASSAPIATSAPRAQSPRAADGSCGACRGPAAGRSRPTTRAACSACRCHPATAVRRPRRNQRQRCASRHLLALPRHAAHAGRRPLRQRHRHTRATQHRRRLPPACARTQQRSRNSAARAEPRGVSDTTPACGAARSCSPAKPRPWSRLPGHALLAPAPLAAGRAPPRRGATGLPAKTGLQGIPAGGEVQALSIDAHIVAFVWRPEGPGVNLDGAWEERVDSLASGRGQLAGSPSSPNPAPRQVSRWKRNGPPRPSSRLRRLFPSSSAAAATPPSSQPSSSIATAVAASQPPQAHNRARTRRQQRLRARRAEAH